MTGRLKNESGFALILTLVVTALMVAVVVEMIHQVYVDTSLSRGFRDGQQASILAESGAIGGKKLLENTRRLTSNYSCISEVWAKPLAWSDETGSIEINVIEEDGKINLNGLVTDNGLEPHTNKILRRLGTLIAHPVPDRAWDNLATWLDTKTPSIFNGADTAEYMALKQPYKARKGKLATIDELTLVKDFTPEMVKDLRPFVTVNSLQIPGSYSQININSAPLMVLKALGDQMNDSMVERVDTERRRGTFTGIGPFQTLTGLTDPIFTVFGNTYRIIAVARVKDSARTVEAVVRLNAQSFLSWQEY
jgi:general secretion pathway protein K